MQYCDYIKFWCCQTPSVNFCLPCRHEFETCYTPSITAPSVELEAGINPETIGYLEAHGTGAKLGDPIEINALKKAFKEHTRKTGFCAVGSAKAHIGHTEGAAGHSH